MAFIKKLLNFYINSSIHVALSVYALTWITLLEFDIEYNEKILYFIFYASITGYNFVKYFGVAKFHHRSLTRWLKWIQIFSFFSFLLMCYYSYQLSVRTLLFVASFGVITFLYAIPFLPKHFFVDKSHNLRSIGGLKIYLIALVWSGVTVFFPIIDDVQTISTDVIITGVQRYIFIVVLMLPFEIRDLQFDSLKLSTIPQKIGIKYTKAIGVFLLIVFFFLEFFKDETKVNTTIVLFVITAITFFLLVRSKKTQTKYYSSFIVESVPVLWLILIHLYT